jgi:archaellum biogenesis protein FlaJ (TadC family)
MLAQKFAEITLDKVIQDYEDEYDERLKRELQSLKPKFWTGVWQSVIGSLIFILVLGLLVFFSWSLKQGPKDLIESMFNVKISPAGMHQTPTPPPQ